MKKYQKRIVDIIFIIIIILFIIEDINNKDLDFELSFFIYLAIIIIYSSIRFPDKRYELDHTDEKKEKIYERYLTNQYSPGLLKYIDDFKIDNDTKIATIMYLELKGLLVVKDRILMTTRNPKDLDKNSTYVYKLIKENNLNNFDLHHYQKLIERDCIKRELLERKPNTSPKVYIRTLKAQNLNNMIDGIKNFFKDFSQIERRTKEEFILWKEYLMYSVLFNINKQAKEEYKKIINIEII